MKINCYCRTKFKDFLVTIKEDGPTDQIIKSLTYENRQKDKGLNYYFLSAIDDTHYIYK